MTGLHAAMVVHAFVIDVGYLDRTDYLLFCTLLYLYGPVDQIGSDYL